MQKKRSGRFIYFLSILGFFAIFSTTLSKNPVLSLFTKSLGASEFTIGLIAALSPLAGILLSFPIGALSDNIGRKKLLIASGFIFMSAPLLYIFITNPLWLIPVRFFHGMATAILGPIAATIIAEKYQNTKGEKLGIYSSATLIGRTIAPILGGALISFYTFSPLLSYRLVYACAFLVGLPVFVMSIFYKESSKSKTPAFNAINKNLATFFKNKKMRSTALIEMATYFAFGAFETYLPLFLQIKGYSAFHAGLIFSLQTLSIALSKPMFGKLADTIDKRYQIIAGVLILGIMFLLLPFLNSFIILVIISLLFGLGMSVSTAATSAYVADISDKKTLGSSMGALSSTMDIGHTFGPFIVGAVITAFSYTYGFASAFVIILLIAIIFLKENFAKPNNLNKHPLQKKYGGK